MQIKSHSGSYISGENLYAVACGFKFSGSIVPLLGMNLGLTSVAEFEFPFAPISIYLSISKVTAV